PQRRGPSQVPPVSPINVLGHVAKVFSTTLGILGSMLVVLFVGLYLAADPWLYANGVIRLVPPLHRDNACKVMEELGITLRYWLFAQIFDMALVAILSIVGL